MKTLVNLGKKQAIAMNEPQNHTNCFKNPDYLLQITTLQLCVALTCVAADSNVASFGNILSSSK